MSLKRLRPGFLKTACGWLQAADTSEPGPSRSRKSLQHPQVRLASVNRRREALSVARKAPRERPRGAAENYIRGIFGDLAYMPALHVYCVEARPLGAGRSDIKSGRVARPHQRSEEH